jgi:maltooligosyltrehalose trehalohydrolase
LHKDLLTLRREDPIFRRQRADQIEAAALTTDCLALRYFDDGDEEAMGAGADRLVIVNFGRQFCYWPVPSPLLAPPQHRQWELLWTSDQVRYGASSTPAVETAKGWHIPAEAAVVLRAVELCDAEGGSARSTPTEERS